MSYLQIMIGGKLRGLKFNQGALMILKEYVDEKNVAATEAYALIYAGLTANAHAKREELMKEVDGVFTPVTYEDVCDWVDSIPDEVMQQINAAWNQSQVYQTRIKPVLDKMSDDELKKNQLAESNTEQSVSESPAVS